MWGGGGSGWVVLIDNGRVNQSKAADALVQVKTTKFGTNVGLNMLLNISSRYFGGLFWSRQLRGLPSSDGYFIKNASLCVERQWPAVCLKSKKLKIWDTCCICQWTVSALVQVTTCCLCGTKLLPEPILTYYQLDPLEQISVKFQSKHRYFIFQRYTLQGWFYACTQPMRDVVTK